MSMMMKDGGQVECFQLYPETGITTLDGHLDVQEIIVEIKWSYA